MTAQTDRGKLERELIMNDLDENKSVEQTAELDEDKLAKLKAKLASQKKEETKPKKQHSINFGVIGSGQMGSRLAEAFYKLGYDCLAVNTASQDLAGIQIPDSNKLLLQNAFGGCAKELSLGKEAAEMHRDQIASLVNTQLADAQSLIFATSLGGGSGAGSCETIIDILAETGKPICVIAALPMESDDAQTKANALQTLSKLAKYAQDQKIHNCVIVDNAKIEAIYHDVGQMEFFNVANKAIVEPIVAFNTYSSKPSNVKSLDPTELLKLWADGGGLSVYGELTISNYQDETAIAEAVISNLNSNLLADGFDLKQSKYVGVIMVANDKVWKQISSSSVNYAMAMINDICGSPKGVFKGIYSSNDITDDVVKIYSMFSGMGLPTSRIEALKKDTQELNRNNKEKDVQRNLALNLDTGTDNTISKVQEIKNKIASKGSVFGKMTGGIVDRRK